MADQSGGRSGSRVREIPASEHPRERLALNGPQGLSSGELLAVVWGNGRPAASAIDAAHDLLNRHGGLGDLARADQLELAQVPGVGLARAAQLVAAFELGRRSLADRSAQRWVIRSPRDAADRLLPVMADLPREELRVLLLNAKNAVLRDSVVYQGNVSTALVRVAELFSDAVRCRAAGLIIAHNHPSGDPEPSPDDLHLTAECVAAGRLLDMPVLDHLIVATGGFVSLRDRGVTFDRPLGWR